MSRDGSVAVPYLSANGETREYLRFNTYGLDKNCQLKLKKVIEIGAGRLVFSFVFKVFMSLNLINGS